MAKSTTQRAIVVAIDGSADSLHAAVWAAAVAARTGTRLHLVHSLITVGHFIADAAVIAMHAAAASSQVDAAHHILKSANDAVRKEFPAVEITEEITTDSADSAVIRSSRDAALAVVGCDDVSPAAALLIGSTSLNVAMHAACPVVAWRGVHAPSDAPVVVGVDPTLAGTAAMAAAFDYADRFGAPVRAVRACSALPPRRLEMLAPGPFDGDKAAAAERAILDDRVGPWTAKYPKAQVVRVFEEGKPARALLDHCQDAQLVVVGTRHHSGLAAAVLGSTALNMLHHSRIPVMICRSQPWHNPHFDSSAKGRDFVETPVRNCTCTTRLQHALREPPENVRQPGFR
ncbi:universal stress protein [Mycolicibacterium sp. J2]|uniref:universal stress protein n=1 Tax=Mycolicibacterium sp. J2 TaxID=2993511 RepID=UPI00224B30C0|nr:universal stress protein [Mycolicibacterium sp. J2]MCX2710453.1 universal stress protein [Mycolicibacterium sp. J2]